MLSSFATDQDAYSLWKYTPHKGVACDEGISARQRKAYTRQI